MSILRTGSTSEYSENWDVIFGKKKKSKSGATKSKAATKNGSKSAKKKKSIKPDLKKKPAKKKKAAAKAGKRK